MYTPTSAIAIIIIFSYDLCDWACVYVDLRCSRQLNIPSYIFNVISSVLRLFVCITRNLITRLSVFITDIEFERFCENISTSHITFSRARNKFNWIFIHCAWLLAVRLDFNHDFFFFRYYAALYAVPIHPSVFFMCVYFYVNPFYVCVFTCVSPWMLSHFTLSHTVSDH